MVDKVFFPYWIRFSRMVENLDNYEMSENLPNDDIIFSRYKRVSTSMNNGQTWKIEEELIKIAKAIMITGTSLLFMVITTNALLDMKSHCMAGSEPLMGFIPMVPMVIFLVGIRIICCICTAFIELLTLLLIRKYRHQSSQVHKDTS